MSIRGFYLGFNKEAPAVKAEPLRLDRSRAFFDRYASAIAGGADHHTDVGAGEVPAATRRLVTGQTPQQTATVDAVIPL